MFPIGIARHAIKRGQVVTNDDLIIKGCLTYSPPPSWPRRLWRWLGRKWRGAVAWVVQREEGDDD